MNILVWHVHGSWTTAFVQGAHTYLVPVLPDRSADGRGRARTWDWPDTVREVEPSALAVMPIDLVVLQRPQDLSLVRSWLKREPGIDLPAVYLEHNTPDGSTFGQRHPMAERDNIPVVHVTHFNAVFWDNGRAPVQVIEHGIIDPGERYSGELVRGAVVVNEPIRRRRSVGTDLLAAFTSVVPLDVFGLGVAGLGPELGVAPDRLGEFDDLPQWAMHQEIARRRFYLHPVRWTSLGLSLLEAMHLGMPIVALASTDVVEAVPPDAGVVSTNLDRLRAGATLFGNEPEEARRAGKAARAAALERYGLARFLAEWDLTMEEAIR